MKNQNVFVGGRNAGVIDESLGLGKVSLVGMMLLSLVACKPEVAPLISYEKNLAALEKTCAGINEEGRVYEPIVGRYLTEKSTTTYIQGAGILTPVTNIIALKNNETVEVYSPAPKIKEFKDMYFPILKSVIYDHLEDSNFKNKIYGICAYRGEAEQYFYKINSLILLK